jgi:hypothetical protein
MSISQQFLVGVRTFKIPLPGCVWSPYATELYVMFVERELAEAPITAKLLFTHR